MAEKCTKTSSPLVRWINPYPFAPLNHFTVPFSRSLTVNSFRSVVAFTAIKLSRRVGVREGNTTGTEGHMRNRTSLFVPEKERPPSSTPHTSASSSGAFVIASMNLSTDSAKFNQFTRLAASREAGADNSKKAKDCKRKIQTKIVPTVQDGFRA